MQVTEVEMMVGIAIPMVAVVDTLTRMDTVIPHRGTTGMDIAMGFLPGQGQGRLQRRRRRRRARLRRLRRAT